MDFYEEYIRPDHPSGRQKHNRQRFAIERERQFGDFTCRHCQQYVSADPSRSGVNNRNHCPRCLWSKHVDLHASGDRLAACKAPMQPVGLTVKHLRKKYAFGQPGELMLVHQCSACGALSINRLAADDDAASVRDVFEAALTMPGAVSAAAQAEGIELLGSEARELVSTRLFGKG